MTAERRRARRHQVARRPGRDPHRVRAEGDPVARRHRRRFHRVGARQPGPRGRPRSRPTSTPQWWPPNGRIFPTRSTTCSHFPGVFRGLLDAHAVGITDQMLIAAAGVIAESVSPSELNTTYIATNPSLEHDDSPGDDREGQPSRKAGRGRSASRRPHADTGPARSRRRSDRRAAPVRGSTSETQASRTGEVGRHRTSRMVVAQRYSDCGNLYHVNLIRMTLLPTDFQCPTGAVPAASRNRNRAGPEPGSGPVSCLPSRWSGPVGGSGVWPTS